MATTNQSIWCDHHWRNISKQLLHAFHIDASNFKDELLKKETQNGQWLHAWLVRAFHEYSTTARETAMIRVTPPNTSNNIYSLMLDITVRRHGATVVASFPAPFDVITSAAASTPAAATSVASTSAASTSAVSTSAASTSAAPTTAVPTTTETATAGLSSTTPNADDVPGPSSSSAGNKGL